MASLSALDFYAPPLLRFAEAAAAPRESLGFQRGLVAPAEGSGATAMRQQACGPPPCHDKNPLAVCLTFRLKLVSGAQSANTCGAAGTYSAFHTTCSLTAHSCATWPQSA